MNPLAPRAKPKTGLLVTAPSLPFIDLNAQRQRIGARMMDRGHHSAVIIGPAVRVARGDAARGLLRRGARAHLFVGHRRAPALSDGQGRRPGRCRALPGLHLRGDRRGDRAARRDAGFCRCAARHVQHGPGQPEIRHRHRPPAQAEPGRRHRRRPVRPARRLRHHRTALRQGRPVAAVRRRAGLWRHLQGPQGRHDR